MVILLLFYQGIIIEFTNVLTLVDLVSLRKVLSNYNEIAEQKTWFASWFASLISGNFLYMLRNLQMKM